MPGPRERLFAFFRVCELEGDGREYQATFVFSGRRHHIAESASGA
jgi:hypothetical protein